MGRACEIKACLGEFGKPNRGRPGSSRGRGPLVDPAPPIEPPLLDARTEIGGEPAAYVCEGFTCNLPVTDPAALERELADLV